MFFHIYKNRFKCMIRDKEMMFWTLIFPLILGTFFELVLSNLSNADVFTKIPIAVITTDEFQQDTIFQTVLNSVSEEGENSLFLVTYTSWETANKLLADNEVDGIILCKEDISLTVKQNGIKQTIIKAFLDDYGQSKATVIRILSGEELRTDELLSTEYIMNDSTKMEKVLEDIFNKKDYLSIVPINKSIAKPYVTCFYSLIGMVCLYGGMLGIKEAIAISADLSPKGARVNMAPTHKLKVFLISMSVAVSIQIIQLFILMLYLMVGLKVDFGDHLGIITLICISGTFTGASFGTLIGVIVKGSEGTRIGVLTATTMLMCFLSGMMVLDIKYLINENIPILAKINPATLITDCFYMLHFYNDYDKIYLNIGILWVITIVFGTIVYMKLRRQKYASL